MSLDIFLRLDGIQGESRDNVHKGEIDLLSWSWGMQQSGTTHLGPGGGSGKVSISDMSFAKYVDKATHNLIAYCSNGKHIATGDLVVRKAGGDAPVEYMKIHFKQILVSSYSTGGSADGFDRVTEQVTLNFAEFNVTYVEQTAEGTAGPAQSAGWNVATNSKV